MNCRPMACQLRSNQQSIIGFYPPPVRVEIESSKSWQQYFHAFFLHPVTKLPRRSSKKKSVIWHKRECRCPQRFLNSKMRGLIAVILDSFPKRALMVL